MCAALTTAAVLLAAPPAAAGADGAGGADARERAVAEKFLAVLERNPRPGVALDRAAAFFAARGELAAVAGRYRDRTFAESDDAAAPAVWGLLELRRGDVPAAAAAFRVAAVRNPDDHRPRALLAAALARSGNHAPAAAALEAALALNPPRRERPALLDALGRALTRAGRGDDLDAALAAQEAAFPDDPAVRARAAAVLAAENRPAAARRRYLALAETARDLEDRVDFAMKAADLALDAGDPAAALAEYGALLDGFEPDGWRAAEARASVERAAARVGGAGAVLDWYRDRVAAKPGEVAAAVRLADLLADAGEPGEAADRLRAAVEIAPADPRPRRALAGLLERAGEFAAAVTEYESLAELLPEDEDVRRAWGRAAAEVPGNTPADAADLWDDWLAGRPGEAAAHARVAGWLRELGAADRALDLERRAADLAPADPAYAAALAESLHAAGRGNEAVAAWRRTTTGPLRTPANLARLAATLSNRDYVDAAAGVAAEAVSLADSGGDRFEPLGVGDRLALARVLAAAGDSGAADVQLAAAEAEADDPAELDSVAELAVELARAAGTLDARLAALAAAADETGAAADHARLARFRAAAGETGGALIAAEDAVAADPSDLLSLELAADLRAAAGRYEAAAEAYGTLADRDRRGRAGHLADQVDALLKTDRRRSALAVARVAAAESPADAAAWGRLAAAAAAAGDDDAALDARRRAAELSDDAAGFLSLAAALRTRDRHAEADAALWRAVAAAGSFDERRAAVVRLAEASARGPADELQARAARIAARLRGEPGL